jgi:hypothetical protein
VNGPPASALVVTMFSEEAAPAVAPICGTATPGTVTFDDGALTVGGVGTSIAGTVTVGSVGTGFFGASSWSTRLSRTSAAPVSASTKTV